MRKDFLGRGWKFPFQFDAGTGSIAMSEHEQNIKECVSVILGTHKGERQMLPEFGCAIHDQMFTPNTRASASIIAHAVESALIRWEPRIEVTSVEAWPDAVGQVRVQVQYKVRSTLTDEEVLLLLNSGG